MPPQQRRECDQHFVAGLVAVGVVDLLEVVDVAHDQAARHPPLQVRLDVAGHDPVELGPVGNLRQRVARGLLVQRLNALLERDLARSIVQQHGRAVRHAALAVDRHQMRVDIDPLAGAAHDRQPPQRLHAGFDRLNHRAFVFAEQLRLFVAEVRPAPATNACARCWRRECPSAARPRGSRA